MTDTNNPVEFVDDDTPELETDQDQNGVDEQVEDDGLDPDDDTPPDDEEYEEVERGDKRYRVPKALKDELMMREDYSRKTQIHSEEVKRFNQEAAAFKEASEEVLQATIQARSIKTRLDDIQALTSEEWRQVRAMDAQDGGDRYDNLMRELTTLPQKLSEAEALSKAKRDEVLNKQSEAQTKLIEQGQAILARDIPGWGPELGNKLVEFVKTNYGIDEQRHGAAFMDPAIVKMAHDAFKAKEANRKNQTQQRAEAIKKAPQANVVKGTAPSTGIHDKLSPEEFARRRNQQLAAKGKR